MGVPKLNFDQTYDVNEPTFDKTFDKAEASVIKMEPKAAATPVKSSGSPTGGSPIGVVSYFPKDGIKQQPKKPIQFVKKESEGESKFNFNNPPKGTPLLQILCMLYCAFFLCIMYKVHYFSGRCIKTS